MVICLYNQAPQSYLDRPLSGRTTVERLVDYVNAVRALDRGDDADTVSLYTTVELAGIPADWEQTVGPALSQQDLVGQLARHTTDAETEILFAFFDQPFLNEELTRRMVARHREYRAEYTFADGYPVGLAPELLSGRAVSHLRQLASQETPVERGGVFPIVRKDINRLDVETVLSRVDQRLLRLVLAVDTRANTVLCDRLAEGAPHEIDLWADHVEARRESHRTLPRFVSVQVIEQEVQRLAYSPYPLMRDDVLAPGAIMSAERFADLVAAVDAFSPEAVVHLSLWGEIGLHPEATRLVRSVLDTPSLSVLVETSGVGWSDGAREELFGFDDERCRVIVGVDSNDRAVYEQVRGDGFEEAHRFAEEAMDRLGKRCYVQAVRCDLTEPALPAFYHEWKERTENIIIEKYDHFSGQLPQRKIGDISPIDRFPCWHLQRDLYVLVDGAVPLCREDTGRATTMGNAFDDGLEHVWRARAATFAEHVNGTYSGICEGCDEYYTFTF